MKSFVWMSLSFAAGLSAIIAWPTPAPREVAAAQEQVAEPAPPTSNVPARRDGQHAARALVGAVGTLARNGSQPAAPPARIELPELAALDRLYLNDPEGRRSKAASLKASAITTLSLLGKGAMKRCAGELKLENIAESTLRIHVRLRADGTRGDIGEILGVQHSNGPAIPQAGLACFERELRTMLPGPLKGSRASNLPVFDDDAYISFVIVDRDACVPPKAN